MPKRDIIINITRACNRCCSYCDVIKDGTGFSQENIDKIIGFLRLNYENINDIKFFGGEPLLAFRNIKKIVKSTEDLFDRRFTIVTNTTLLDDETGVFFNAHFKLIFMSIDSENEFDYEKVSRFIRNNELEDKTYFNLVVLPGKEQECLERFRVLYRRGFRKFNILPVYNTKPWSKKNLLDLSKMMKELLDIDLDLYGFQQNEGKKIPLFNRSIFIDTDMKAYHSDMICTESGSGIKKQLFLGEVEGFRIGDLDDFEFINKDAAITVLEKMIYEKVPGQRELHDMMDYFSVYLNNKDEL